MPLGAAAPVNQQATPTQMPMAAQVRVPVAHGLRHTNEQPGGFGRMCGAALLALFERTGSAASEGKVVVVGVSAQTRLESTHTCC